MFTMKTIKTLAGAVLATALYQSAAAGCNTGPYCTQDLGGYGQAEYMPYSQSTLTTAQLSPVTMPGLGMNERLSPTTCPVDVYNPEGGQVLGCYDVYKPVAPVVIQPPVVEPVTVMNQVRVVRPIVYVRYPVPTPVYPMPMPVCPAMPMGGVCY